MSLPGSAKFHSNDRDATQSCHPV